MPRVFMAPGYYVQGPGSLDLVGEKAAELGRRLVMVCDADVLPLVGDRLIESCNRSRLGATTLPFSGEVTQTAIEDLTERARAHSADVIAGVGGGRSLDAAKGVARRLGAPFISIPTIASTDAAASRGIAIYDDERHPVAVEQLDRNPDCVIVDTAVIAEAPVRFLRSGIGDAVSKVFEVEACLVAGGLTKHGAKPLLSALMIADACYGIIREHGVAAMIAVERHEVTAELEAAVEAIVLLSCMAFENGGLSLAHAMVPGVARLGGARDTLHGDHVAYGTLVQLAFEGRAYDEIQDLERFLRTVGLPVSLAELGLADPTEEEITGLITACLANSHAHNQRRPVDAAGLRAAIDAVERNAQSSRTKRT